MVMTMMVEKIVQMMKTLEVMMETTQVIAEVTKMIQEVTNIAQDHERRNTGQTRIPSLVNREEQEQLLHMNSW